MHQPHCRRARNQQLCYWSKSRTCFHLTWMYFPLKNTLLLRSDNLSLAGRWRMINMNTGESSCLETNKVGMERNLFFKQTQDKWILSTCCLHKSTCWHCPMGLPRDSLQTKPMKSWKIYGMQNILHNWLWISRYWSTEKIGSISLGKGIDKNRKSCRVIVITSLNGNGDKRFLSVLLLTCWLNYIGVFLHK